VATLSNRIVVHNLLANRREHAAPGNCTAPQERSTTCRSYGVLHDILLQHAPEGNHPGCQHPTPSSWSSRQVVIAQERSLHWSAPLLGVHSTSAAHAASALHPGNLGEGILALLRCSTRQVILHPAARSDRVNILLRAPRG